MNADNLNKMNIPFDIFVELPYEFQVKYLTRVKKLDTAELNTLTDPIKTDILTNEFLEKVNKHSGVFSNELTTECWRWEGATYPTEYGQLGRARWGENYAHRWSYTRWNGPITSDLVRHTCDNRWCVNPEHLIDGTREENIRDMEERNPKAHGRKLQPAEYPKIVERMEAGELLKDIAEEYGMNWKSVSRALDKAGVRPEYKQKKLTAEQVAEIKADTRTYKVIGEEYKISPSIISKIKNNTY